MLSFLFAFIPSFILLFTDRILPTLSVLLFLTSLIFGSLRFASLAGPLAIIISLFPFLLLFSHKVRKNLKRLFPFTFPLYAFSFLPYGAYITLAIFILALLSLLNRKTLRAMLILAPAFHLAVNISASFYLGWFSLSFLTLLFAFLGYILEPVKKRQKEEESVKSEE